MVFSLPVSQELTFDVQQVDAVAAWNHPAVLAATMISTSLLFLALTKASLAWQRSKGIDAGRRILLVLLGCASYLIVAGLQIGVSQAFFRIYEHYDRSVS